MINIAFVIQAIETPTGGTEKQLLLLLKHLDRKEFNPVLCVLRTSEWLESEFRDCPVYRVGVRSFKDPRSILAIWNLSRFFIKQRIDIVHVFFKDSTKVGVLASKLAGVPVLIASRRNQGYELGRIEFLLLKLLDRRADLIVANSQSTRKWVEDVEGIPNAKIEVVYNGIDLSRFPMEGMELRQRYRRLLGIPDDAIAIGIVANLRPIKGHEVFLRAAQLVKKAIPTARFILVGDGELRESLERLASELGIRDNVSFLGSRCDVETMLAALDIGVLSSGSESFSNAVVEYMAAGLPIVCTDVGGAREVIEDGAHGFVVPVGDHHTMADRLLYLVASGDRARMGRVGRERAVQHFSVGAMVGRYEAIFRSECSRMSDRAIRRNSKSHPASPFQRQGDHGSTIGE